MDYGSDGTMQMDETGTLLCKLKLQEEVKGAVSEVLSEQEMREKKYENLSEAWEVMYALCDVYCLPETPVEAWASLVTEAAGLIAALAVDPTGGEVEQEGLLAKYMETDAAKASFTEKKAAQFVEKDADTKAGRVLSEKNRGIIGSAKDAMASGIAALEELLKATETATEEVTSEGDGKKVEPSKESRELTSYQKFVEMRKVLRAINTGLSRALEDAKLK